MSTIRSTIFISKGDNNIAILEEDLNIIQNIHSITASDTCITNKISYLTDKGAKFNSELCHEILGMFGIDYVAIKKTVEDAEALEQYLQQYRHEFLLLPESDNKSNKLFIDLDMVKSNTTYYLEHTDAIPTVNARLFNFNN